MNTRYVIILFTSAMLLAVFFHVSAGAAEQRPPVDVPPYQEATSATPESTISPTATLTPSATLTPTMTHTTTATVTATGTLTGTLSTSTPTATNTPAPTAAPFSTIFYFPAAYYQAPPAPPSCVPQPDIPATDLSRETELVAHLNLSRVNATLSELSFSNGPTQASRRHANDMAFNGVESFTGSDGSSPGERLRDACYDWVAVGQMIGWGYANPETMADFWINSPAHNVLILDPLYDDMGPAYAFAEDSKWKHYWAVTFAQPAGPNIRIDQETAVFSCTVETVTTAGGTRLTWIQKEPCPS